MSFEKKFQRFDEDSARKRAEEMAAELAGGNASEAKRLRVEDGLNVWWVLPKVGSMFAPYLFKYVHYNPFHICGRKDPVPDPNDPDKLIEDRNFRNCYRDSVAWKLWEEAGKPESGPLKDKFKADMPSIQVAVQAVNLTPFFELDSTKTFATPKKALVEQWGDAFVTVLKGGPVPDGMPEEIAKAAQTGVRVTFLNQNAGKTLRKQHVVKCVEIEDDPFFNPDKYLVQIVRADDDKSFKDAVGRTRKGKSYDIRFTAESKMKAWKLPQGLMDAVVDLAVDVNAIPVEDDSDIPSKVEALHRLTEAELKTYLAETNHSFTPPKESGEESARSENAEFSMSNPDAFSSDADSALSVRGRKSLADLRRQVEED
jgi:hypothetical protein